MTNSFRSYSSHAVEIIRMKDPESADSDIAKAAEIILSGGIVAIPTETFYGLAVSALDENAIMRLLAVKHIREERHPILILIPSRQLLHLYVRKIPPIADALIERFWPGGITLVLEAAPNISPLLTAGTGKIGVRLSSHPVAAGLARAVGSPITGTSANVTGRPPCQRAEQVVQSLGEVHFWARIGTF